MMNKETLKQVRSFLTGALAMMILIISIAPISANTKQAIDVIYNNIKIMVDGRNVSFGKDSTGKTIEPFIYNGTTYLPVRAVGEALGKDVKWDGKTQTVYLGKDPSGEKLFLRDFPPYSADRWYVFGQTVNGSNSEAKIGGNAYHEGIYGSISRAMNRSSHFNLNGEVSEISGTYGLRDGADHALVGKVYIYGDDILLETLEFKGGELPKDFKIDVTGVLKLTLTGETWNYVYSLEPYLTNIRYK